MGFIYQEENCFVCGRNNLEGLQLKFQYFPEGRSLTKLTFEARHQGYDGIVHGGVLTAVLDDSMAHALVAVGVMPVTVTMNIRFHKPVLVGEEITFEGEAVSTGRRFVEAKAVAKGPDGDIRVSAEGKFVTDFVEVRADALTGR